MQKIKPYILPIAIVLGLLLHSWCARASFVVPYIIFTILILTFSAVDLKKLKPSMLDLWIVLFQMVVSMGTYLLLRALNVDIIIAEGVLIGVLCPVAASVAVISCMLGANRETVTTYTIIGNLMVAIVAPLYFTIIGCNDEIGFWASVWLILKRIGPIIGFPFFIILALQIWAPKANNWIAKYKAWSFYLWSFALFFTLGQTIDFIFLHGEGNWHNIAWLGAASFLFCVIQFGLGKLLGKKYGDTIAGGQLLGQKNSAMGIWMANTFMHPLASVFMAFYSIFQNIFNSWQIWYFEKKRK